MSSLFNTIFLGVNKSLQNEALSSLRMFLCGSEDSQRLLRGRAGGTGVTHLRCRKGPERAAATPPWSSWWLEQLWAAELGFCSGNTTCTLSSGGNHTYMYARTTAGVCLCMFIFALSTLILQQHFQPFVSVAISTEVSCAVSQEGCFCISRSHKKFRCVRYTLCVVILSEIRDSSLLKDHGKFLQAKERLHKLLSGFLCVHLSVPIFVQCFFMRKTQNEMLP